MVVTAMNLANKVLSRFSHETAAGFKYYPIIPYGFYAPWSTDADFLRVYDKVERNSLVDIFKCYELWKLVEETEGVEGCLIEVGTWRGASGAIIASKAAALGSRAKVYLCDTFTGVVKAGSHDSSYRGGEHADTSEHFVSKLVQELRLTNVQILKGIFPEETGHLLQEQKIRFCHIDVDVYQSAKDIVEFVWSRMDAGAVIVFDDYGYPDMDGITRFVEEERWKDDRIVIHNLNGHGIFVKIAPVTGSAAS